MIEFKVGECMKYIGMPSGMWLVFGKSFERNLTSVLGVEQKDARKIRKKAKRKYKDIIESLPEFEREDVFKMNIVNCAMLSAFFLNMNQRPSVEDATEYYAKAMMTRPMMWFCRMSGKNKFSANNIKTQQSTAKLKAADRNPYSWNMEFYEYEDGSGYEARFTKCGICTLMNELGLTELIPAMCRLDYTMSEAGGASVFVREQTLASGGQYCDCGYKKKEMYNESLQ